jgi:hypothetical protein
MYFFGQLIFHFPNLCACLLFALDGYPLS